MKNPTDLMLSCPQSSRILQFMVTADFAQGSSENWEVYGAGSNCKHMSGFSTDSHLVCLYP